MLEVTTPAYPKVGENRVRHVEAVDALAAEFGVAADAAATKVLEAKAHAVVVLVQFVHSDLHLLLVCQRAAQTGHA